MNQEKSNMDEKEMDEIKEYLNFAGVLIGISIALVALVLSFPKTDYDIYLELSVIFLFTSAFFWLQNYSWFLHYLRTGKQRHFDVGSFAYYIGYLALILAINYLFRSYGLKLAQFVAFVIAVYILYQAMLDLGKDIKAGGKYRIVALTILIGYIVSLFFSIY